MLNDDIAAKFERVAVLLEEQHANPFRIRAYQDAARTLQRLKTPVTDIYRAGGKPGLVHVPTIGDSLADAIIEIVETGRYGTLERLEGEHDAVTLFATLPGVGDQLAQRLVEEHGFETLEELEVAAHDGSLDDIEGFGAKRVQGIKDTLAVRLSRRPPAPVSTDPDIGLLLRIDETYRDRATLGVLRKIAPLRFNPRGEAWLPIMHEEFDGWNATVLYSNTARAHELGKIHDWVVIYATHEEKARNYQCTIVTEGTGPLRGRRVVRGRENETRAHYAAQEAEGE